MQTFTIIFTGMLCLFAHTSALPTIIARQSAPIHSGTMTYYDPNGGLGTCGNAVNNGDYSVAISQSYIDNNNACGATINVIINDTTTALTVVDACESCGDDDIDVPQDTYNAIAGDTGAGSTQVTWYSNEAF